MMHLWKQAENNKKFEQFVRLSLTAVNALLSLHHLPSLELINKFLNVEGEDGRK